MTRRRLVVSLTVCMALGAVVMHVSFSTQPRGPVGTLTQPERVIRSIP